MLLNRKKRKIKFKNNSEYLIPKVVKNNSVLNFNISYIDIEVLGNLSYLNIYYNVMSKNTKNYLRSLLKTEDNLFSCDYCMLDDNLYYCCKYLIPKKDTFFANMCVNNTCVYTKSDIDKMLDFCKMFIQLYTKSQAARESNLAIFFYSETFITWFLKYLSLLSESLYCSYTL